MSKSIIPQPTPDRKPIHFVQGARDDLTALVIDGDDGGYYWTNLVENTCSCGQAACGHLAYLETWSRSFYPPRLTVRPPGGPCPRCEAQLVVVGRIRSRTHVWAVCEAGCGYGHEAGAPASGNRGYYGGNHRHRHVGTALRALGGEP